MELISREAAIEAFEKFIHEIGIEDAPFGRRRKMSVCDDCERAEYWECIFCCAKCYEDYGECPNPDCNPMDI